MQKKLVKNDNAPNNNNLIIKQFGKQKLSKSQDLFNKLTKKIETLQAEINKKKKQLDTALSLYATKLYPILQQLLKQREVLIITLWNLYKANKLSKVDQRSLKKMVQYHLDIYLQEIDMECSETIQKIFEEVDGINYQQVIEDEKEKMQAEMRAAFAKENIHITDDDFADENKMAEKIALAKEKMKIKEAANQYKYQQRQKKSTRQINYEKQQQAIEDLKKKNIGTIYKQLAKLFHPDLELDEFKKAEKEILMKQLTVAYEAKDLHALLMLELKWIHNQQNHIADITDDKMSIYLEILKEQVQDLSHEKNSILHHPQYNILAEQYGYNIQQYPIEIINKDILNQQQISKIIEQDLEQLSSETAFKHAKTVIKNWVKKEKEEWEEAAMFDAFWN
jgi:hypothetical protein